MTIIPKDDLLKRVRVATPCPADWDKMVGDARVRFCGSCKLNVYNLSDMSRAEAETLVRQAEGDDGKAHLCVRFYQRADGTMITADCPVGLLARATRGVRRRVAFYASCGAALTLTSLSWARGQQNRSPFSDEVAAIAADPQAWREYQPVPVRTFLQRVDPAPITAVAGGISVAPAPPRELGRVTMGAPILRSRPQPLMGEIASRSPNGNAANRVDK